MVRDIFTGGVRTFLSREDAQAFRAQIYAQHGAVCVGARRYLAWMAPNIGPWRG